MESKKPKDNFRISLFSNALILEIKFLEESYFKTGY